MRLTDLPAEVATKQPAKPSPEAAVKIVVCPCCQGNSVYASSNPFRPFCGERCKNIDLGAWASERFRVQAVAKADDDPQAV
jgi:uncharacterized protein